MAVFRRQMSMDGCDNGNHPPPAAFRLSFHGRTVSEDRSSISSCSSERGMTRSDSQCSLTKRSFLRKRIMELKELESGVRAGHRAVCFTENPQLGSVKWVGKINQIVCIGMEFDHPIGTNYPKTKEAPLPFPCKIAHGRLVSHDDLLLVTDQHGKTIMSKQKPDNLKIMSNSLDIPISQAAQEFAIKLQEFYDFGVNGEDALDKLGGELDQACSRRLTVDPISISIALERHKSYLNQVEDRYSLIDWCQSKSEELFTYDDILLPSDERRINRTIKELTNMHKNIEKKLKRRIRDLEWALESCQTVQDLLQQKLEWLTGAKAKLRKMEKSLIKSESQLSSRLSLIESLLGSFTPKESDELVEILEKISQLHELTGNSPELDVHVNDNEDQSNNKFDAQLCQIMSTRNQLLDEIGTKYELYKDAQKLFQKFSKSVSSFENWYAKYMEKVFPCDGSSISNSGESNGLRTIDFQFSQDIVQEREIQRKEFLKIFKTARKLRVSIFDPSVLDDKIQGLQIKWRNLMDVCYQDKFRKIPDVI